MLGDESILTIVGSTCLGDGLLLNEVCLHKIYFTIYNWAETCGWNYNLITLPVLLFLTRKIYYNYNFDKRGRFLISVALKYATPLRNNK